VSWNTTFLFSFGYPFFWRLPNHGGKPEFSIRDFAFVLRVGFEPSQSEDITRETPIFFSVSSTSRMIRHTSVLFDGVDWRFASGSLVSQEILPKNLFTA
jgi:hypothetical protein